MTGLDRESVLTRQLQGKSKIPFPFSAGWADTAVAGHEGASYSRHGRVVQLQGAVTKTSGSPASNDVIGVLPAGFRPTGLLVFPAVTNFAFFGVVVVDSVGQVVWFAGSATETDHTSLSGIAFVVD